MSLLRLDYWTGMLTLVLLVLLILGNFFPLEDPSQYLFLLVLAYLAALLIHPYFKKQAFRKTVIFDFVGVVAEGTEETYYTGEVQLRAGMKKLIERLKRNNKVVLFTNNNWEAHQPFSRRLGLDKLFDFEFASGQIGARKPTAEAYRIILKEVGSRPSDSVMIDDRVENLTGAKEIGMHTVHFITMEKMVADLRALGYKF